MVFEPCVVSFGISDVASDLVDLGIEYTKKLETARGYKYSDLALPGDNPLFHTKIAFATCKHRHSKKKK